MEDDLLCKVKPEALDTLMDALCEVLEQMKEAEPNKVDRYRDDSYVGCLTLSNKVLLALKKQILKGYTGEKVEG